jgi:hypothetical protein
VVDFIEEMGYMWRGEGEMSMVLAEYGVEESEREFSCC